MPQQYVCRWSGARIGAGASVFNFASIAGSPGAATIASSTRALMNNFASILPDEVTIQFDAEVKELQDDGTLVAVYPVTQPTPVIGTNTGVFSNGTGILVRHTTGAIVSGRRLYGRTFLVPLVGAVFANNGDVNGTQITSINAAFATFIAANAATGSNFSVWSRSNTLTTPVTASNAQSRPSRLQKRNDRL